MAETEVNRKLAAILSADVVGYGKLMADDEAATVETLKKYRAAIARVVERRKGRVVNAPGDNILAEFPSAVEAVQAAVEIQQSIRGRNVELAPERRMEFRVGINLGDVIEEDDGTIYGDGVNIAARMEALAEDGGICISSTVYDAVEGKLDFGFDYLGEQPVKNIAKPVRVYRVRGEATTSPAAPAFGSRRHRNQPILIAAAALVVALIIAGVAWQQLTGSSGPEQVAKSDTTAPPADPISALPDGPSIAVLPFAKMSGDSSQDYFADGMTERIISELARFRDLLVIARNSTFQYKGKAVDVREIARELGVRYVVEGSVRRDADTVRVTAQLIDATTGGHLWSESYEGTLAVNSIFGIQDAIAEQLVATIATSNTGVVSRTERWRAKESKTDHFAAYDCLLKAHDFVINYTNEKHIAARDCLIQAVELDPGYVDAWAWLAWVYLYGYADEFDDTGTYLRLGHDAAQRAVKLDPANQTAHYVMAMSRFFQHDLTAFKDETEKAVSLNPNNAFVVGDLAVNLMFTGDWDHGFELLREAMALNPHFPTFWWFPVAKRHLVREEYDKVVAMEKVAMPDFWIFHLALAYVYAHAGREEDAARAVESLLKLSPEMTVQKGTDLYERYNFEPSYIDLVADGLRKAGLPDGTPTN